MLHVAHSLVEAVRAAPNASALYQPIQLAIELEHSTLPPYLAALFSLDAGRNKAIAAILSSVVNDEMLHMAIMANLLNAIGGEPAMNDPAFVPKYPGKLPMSVGNGVLVGIAPFSIELVRDVFMKIEEPETPLEFPEAALQASDALGPQYATIGEFYRALSDKLGEIGDSAFTGSVSRQLVDPRWFSVDRLFVISNVQTAQSAIALIVQEGEGTKQSPLDGSGTEIAHYYRFGGIVRGHQLRPTAAEPGFAWDGEAVPFDSDGVYSFQPDLKLADLTPGSRAHEVASRFADAYTRLLNSLHRTFNGEPAFIGNAIAVMFELRVAALDCLYTRLGDPTHVGLCFEPEPGVAL